MSRRATYNPLSNPRKKPSARVGVFALRRRVFTTLRRLATTGFALLSVWLLSSCSELRKLSPNESLLISNRVQIESTPGKRHKDKRLSDNNLEVLITQEPNSRFLGMRLKLALYNGAKDSARTAWGRRIRENGEPPVVFDSLSIAQSIDRMRRYLGDKGYFEPDFSVQVKRVGKQKRKIKVRYKATLNEPYRIRSIKTINRDDSVAAVLSAQNSKSLLAEGQIYDVETLDKERERLTGILRNEGYYAFNKEYIYYRIDSALQNHEMDVTLHLRRVQSSETDSLGNHLYRPHKKYYIDEVYFLPRASLPNGQRSSVTDTVVYYEVSARGRKRQQGKSYRVVVTEKMQTRRHKPKVRPAVLVQKTFLSGGDLFSAYQVSRSYDNLSDLRIFGYTDIRIFEKPYDSALSYEENNRLECHIDMVEGKKYGLSTEAELTTSAGFMPGVAANLTFQNRNLFRGGEILNVRLRGMYELQSTLDNDRNRSFLNTFELKGEVSLDFPRLLAPLSWERRAKAFRTKSTVSLSYSYQDKVEYARGIFLATWGYSWRSGRIQQIFNPIEINTVQMLRVSQRFKDNLEALSKTNLRLKYQYEDHFILDWRYQLIYNDRKSGETSGFNVVRFNVETAGNLLYGIAKVAQVPQNELKQYQIFGLAFSQYARMDVDYKRHFVFGQDVDLVARVLLGAGYSYLNSMSLPYEKSFYAGGSTLLRAWPLYQVGPGSYANPNNYRMERLGDMALVMNLEQRFPIFAGLKGAVFLDAGNVWLLKNNPEFEGGVFDLNKFYKDLYFGAGAGLRYDFKFFVVRVDMGIPLYSPAVEDNQRWVIKKLSGKDLVFNFGIGYPF